MNNLDRQYTDLLQDILDNGTRKMDRTGTGTISVFGRQIRHKMSDGFPLLTTKKMPFKTIVTELLWFLRGDTNIKYLVDNNCHIWDGDAYKNYLKWANEHSKTHLYEPYSQEQFINKIKTDAEFAKAWGELGPIYGKQWRGWTKFQQYEGEKTIDTYQIDQIANLINDLKTNPDSRRLLVSAWNPADLPNQVLPPCHYGFQVYTRELSREERVDLYIEKYGDGGMDYEKYKDTIPTRAISLIWNQRSVDTFLGLPFNIASYGLLLEIIAKEVNMVPDELIGNLGDTHLYLNHIEQAKEQIGGELSFDERSNIYKDKHNIHREIALPFVKRGGHNLDEIPKRTREPFQLPKLDINTEFWLTESGECGVGPLATNLQGLEISDFQIQNYQSHPSIKAPLSN
jgi:thymidylate synthase